PQLTPLRSLNAPQPTSQIIGTPFSMSGELCAVATDGAIELLNTSTEKRVRLERNDAAALALSPNKQVLAVAAGSGMGLVESAIRLLDANTGKPLSPALEGHLAWVGAIVFWPDGRTMASASADRTIRLWDVSDPAHPKPIGRPLRGHTHEVRRLALLPD